MQRGFEAGSLHSSPPPRKRPPHPGRTSPLGRIQRHPTSSLSARGSAPNPRSPRCLERGAAQDRWDFPSSLRTPFFTCVPALPTAFPSPQPRRGRRDGLGLGRPATGSCQPSGCTASQRGVVESRQRGSHGSRRGFYPLPTETKECDERAGTANQRGAGAGSRAVSSRTQMQARGGGREGGGEEGSRSAARQVQLGCLAWESSRLFPSPSLLLPGVSSAPPGRVH